jgi:hypothetical protein
MQSQIFRGEETIRFDGNKDNSLSPSALISKSLEREADMECHVLSGLIFQSSIKVKWGGVRVRGQGRSKTVEQTDSESLISTLALPYIKQHTANTGAPTSLRDKGFSIECSLPATRWNVLQRLWSLDRESHESYQLKRYRLPMYTRQWPFETYSHFFIYWIIYPFRFWTSVFSVVFLPWRWGTWHQRGCSFSVLTVIWGSVCCQRNKGEIYLFYRAVQYNEHSTTLEVHQALLTTSNPLVPSATLSLSSLE